MVRQSLEPDSAYADAAVHGDGLTSLQYREPRGPAPTRSRRTCPRPRGLRIEKAGRIRFHVHCRPTAEQLAARRRCLPAGAQRSVLRGPGGLRARQHGRWRRRCSAEVRADAGQAGCGEAGSGQHAGDGADRVQGPAGHLSHHEPYRGARTGRATAGTSSSTAGAASTACRSKGANRELIDTGFATRCNNDHGFSPDGTQLVISDQSQETASRSSTCCRRRAARRGASRRWGRPTGTAGRRTGRRWRIAPSANGEFDVYTIPAAGGEETRLTTAAGWTTARNTRRTASSSTSTPTAPADADLADEAGWQRAGAGDRRTSSTTGFRIHRPTANGSCSCPMRRT